jgi:hypothetical protein
MTSRKRAPVHRRTRSHPDLEDTVYIQALFQEKLAILA